MAKKDYFADLPLKANHLSRKEVAAMALSLDCGVELLEEHYGKDKVKWLLPGPNASTMFHQPYIYLLNPSILWHEVNTLWTAHEAAHNERMTPIYAGNNYHYGQQAVQQRVEEQFFSNICGFYNEELTDNALSDRVRKKYNLPINFGGGYYSGAVLNTLLLQSSFSNWFTNINIIDASELATIAQQRLGALEYSKLITMNDLNAFRGTTLGRLIAHSFSISRGDEHRRTAFFYPDISLWNNGKNPIRKLALYSGRLKDEVRDWLIGFWRDEDVATTTKAIKTIEVKYPETTVSFTLPSASFKDQIVAGKPLPQETIRKLITTTLAPAMAAFAKAYCDQILKRGQYKFGSLDLNQEATDSLIDTMDIELPDATLLLKETSMATPTEAVRMLLSKRGDKRIEENLVSSDDKKRKAAKILAQAKTTEMSGGANEQSSTTV